MNNESEKIRAIIVDDEELARHVVREMLSEHSEIEVVAECANGFEAVKAVSEVKPDLVFLDVQMPKLDGFEVLELVGQDVATIFVTAYDQYALKAFEVHAVDYLLKPFSRERFETALERAKERKGSHPDASAVAAAARPQGQYPDRIVVRDGANVRIIPIAKIDYIEAQDDYISICAEGKKQLKQQTISSVETMLDPTLFLRIHRSFIANLERIAKVDLYGKDSRIAILQDGTRLPVSRAGYGRLRTLLGEAE